MILATYLLVCDALVSGIQVVLGQKVKHALTLLPHMIVPMAVPNIARVLQRGVSIASVNLMSARMNIDRRFEIHIGTKNAMEVLLCMP